MVSPTEHCTTIVRSTYIPHSLAAVAQLPCSVGAVKSVWCVLEVDAYPARVSCGPCCCRAQFGVRLITAGLTSHSLRPLPSASCFCCFHCLWPLTNAARLFLWALLRPRPTQVVGTRYSQQLVHASLALRIRRQRQGRRYHRRQGLRQRAPRARRRSRTQRCSQLTDSRTAARHGRCTGGASDAAVWLAGERVSVLARELDSFDSFMILA